MLKRIVFILCLVAIIPAFLTSSLQAAEAKKGTAWKVKGALIPHPDSNDVKVLMEDYESVLITVNEKTKITATVKAKMDDLAKEAEGKLPKGEVTFTIVDGKPVATGITYGSGQTWKVAPPKPKKD